MQLVGEQEVAAAKARQTDPALPRYFFDKATNQAIIVDWRDNRPGDKQFHWEQRGVPFRIEVGPRDVDANAFVLKKRLDRSKEIVPARRRHQRRLAPRPARRDPKGHVRKSPRLPRRQHPHGRRRYDELKKLVAETGGFVRCHFTPNREIEAKIKEETKATVRCIPFDYNGDQCHARQGHLHRAGDHDPGVVRPVVLNFARAPNSADSFGPALNPGYNLKIGAVSVETAMTAKRRLGKEDFARIGHMLYARRIRPKLAREKKGRVVAMDIKTADYEVADDVLTAADRLRARQPEAKIWLERVGYRTLHRFGVWHKERRRHEGRG